MPASRLRRWAPRVAAIYFLFATAALVWPLYPWLGNHIEPRLLGLPWSLVYVLLAIASNFAVLLVLYRMRLVDDLELPGAIGADPGGPQTPDEGAGQAAGQGADPGQGSHR